VGQPVDEQIQKLWAKTGKQGQTHLLVYHLIDVAEVARLMWSEGLDEPTKDLVSHALSLTCEEAGQFAAFLIGLHDLGKASPDFQRKYEPIIPVLKDAGLPFGLGIAGTPHGIISTLALGYRGRGLLIERGLVPDRKLAGKLAAVIGGHHGSWPAPSELAEADRDSGSGLWAGLREALFGILYNLYHPPALLESYEISPEALNAGLVLLSGLTTIADWLGSMEEYFDYQQKWLAPQDYQRVAKGRAHYALQDTGWLAARRTYRSLAFGDVLPHEAHANPTQQAVLAAVKQVHSPSLVILEAPTGTGKTELAFYFSALGLDTGQYKGIYIAMPTQATSNQMVMRAGRLLQLLEPDPQRRPRLLHSQAAWVFQPDSLPSNIHDNEQYRSPVGSISPWFLPKKRGLLEPFAVGTVDQVLLSVLWTRHFFVRLFGLANKSLVFDEVHAYDTYMTELFVTLLAWLKHTGATVTVLSATLPNRSRKQLVEVMGGDGSALTGTDAAHSRLTVIDEAGNTVAVSLCDSTQGRRIHLNWLSSENLADSLAGRLENGGCVAVICNTVLGAQAMYRQLRAVQDSGMLADCEISLFHARYPAAWRRHIEERALRDFGKEGPRPRKAILVATQVIEQSLDLDFDLLITEMPPVDFLIQRMGRLHRHPRAGRPEHLQQPECLVIQPELVGDSFSFGGSDDVYDRFVLLATHATLAGREELILPDESRDLIEFVYGDGWRASDRSGELAEAYSRMLSAQQGDTYQAQLKHIPLPSSKELFQLKNDGLDEDDPTLHHAFRAMTRLIEPSVQVICPHRTRDGLSLEPDGARPVDLKDKPDPCLLLQYTVSVSHKGVFQHLANCPEFQLPSAWGRDGALKYHRLAVFVEGVCRVPGSPWFLILSPETGLEITKGV
jgi:CRISPR-associated endonuclease/helicase Cas3